MALGLVTKDGARQPRRSGVYPYHEEVSPWNVLLQDEVPSNVTPQTIVLGEKRVRFCHDGRRVSIFLDGKPLDTDEYLRPIDLEEMEGYVGCRIVLKSGSRRDADREDPMSQEYVMFMTPKDEFGNAALTLVEPDKTHWTGVCTLEVENAYQ